MSKVSEFLTENSVQYLASVSLDGKAKCRPCMFSFEKDGKPCHQKTYDNEEIVRQMVAEQKDMKIPTELIPKCPVCGAPMTMNLRSDMTFVQDEGWYSASNRYDDFIRRHKDLHILFLELGVGANTPVFRFLSTRNKLRKNTVKQQILDISHDKTRKYEERRCA